MPTASSNRPLFEKYGLIENPSFDPVANWKEGKRDYMTPDGEVFIWQDSPNGPWNVGYAGWTASDVQRYRSLKLAVASIK